jgi:hypothetical protein
MEQGIIAGTGRSVSARRGAVTLAGAVALLATVVFAHPAAAVSKSTKPICGNNVAEASEACDGSDLRSKTCQSLGFAGGSLSCAGDCTYQTGSCLSLLRYQDNHDGTVTDLSSGLQWEQKNAADGVQDFTNPHDVDNEYTWGNLAGCPIAGCPNGTAFTDFLGRLNYNISGDGTTTIWPCFAGHCDWRLPTIDELATIIDFNSSTCSNGPCIDPIFGPSLYIYGSSTTDTLDPFPAYAWIIYPWSGKKNPLPKTSKAFNLRAVRSAD